MDEKSVQTKNTLYFDQMVDADKSRPRQKPKKKKKAKASKSFGSQVVEIGDYLHIPDGYEYIAYIFYFIFIPYLAGAIFLFFAVARADFHNFQLLNGAAFFIVWAIGYEIVATLVLLYILSLFLRYDENEE
ncbi:MAG: hypothetical protein U9O86_00610 [Campylobacterota bacterium]|nr:hypothetical protein [Campylobacterota bacterium]